MNAEGIARMLSAEWIRAIATAIPVVLALWWVLKGQGWLWRRSVWQAIGADALDLEAEFEGSLSAKWTGFECRAAGWTVRWHGGLWGPVTVVHLGGERRRMAGWLGGSALRAALTR